MKEPTKDYVSVNVYMHKSLNKKLKARSKQERRSKSAIIVLAIEKDFKDYQPS